MACKRAIVIGASSGIGLEVAKLLIKDGWQVGVAARRMELMQGKRNSSNGIWTYYPLFSRTFAVSKIQLMDAILKELSSEGFSESEASDFWSDFDNLQKAKIVR